MLIFVLHNNSGQFPTNDKSPQALIGSALACHLKIFCGNEKMIEFDLKMQDEKNE